MSLGGHKSQSTTDVRLNGININQSSYGNCIPLVYGRNRVPLTLLWYGNFISTPHTTTQSGGKGGGGGGGNTTFTYSASLIMGLCEGPMSGAVGQVFQDKVITSLSTLGFTQFFGNGGQAPWSYLTTNYPSQAVPYDHTAYVAVANYALGSSAAIPNFTFEVSGFLSLPATSITFTSGLALGATSATLSSSSVVPSGLAQITFSDYECRTCTVAGNAVTWSTTQPLINAVLAGASLGGFDADPAAVLVDYCTDPNHGCAFPYLGTITGSGVTTFQSYCYAAGIFLSPYESTQRTAVAFIKEILQITNSDAFMSAGVLSVVPYGDTSITGNGRTYTPNLTPLFAFTEDDLMAGKSAGSDPIKVMRKPLALTYNTVRVEYLDRSNAYNTAIAEATDANDIAINGVRVMSTLTFHSITTGAVAQVVAQLIMQRKLYIRSTFTFCVRMDYCLLEPGDLVSITDAGLGFLNKLVRIIQVDDDVNDLMTIIAEDMLVGSAHAPLYNYQAAQGYAANYGVAPPSVAPPLIFVAPPLLCSENGGYQVWIAADQNGTGSWGGCDVYASLDNVSYVFQGTINGAARYGALTSALAANPDPDTTDTLQVQLTNNLTTTLQLASGSAADYQNLRTLIYVDGEIMAYETATLTGPGDYNLSPLRRGQYGSGAVAHAVGAIFARLDAAIFQLEYDVGWTGQTLYFKFCSFNIFGKSHQTLAQVPAYPYLLRNNNAGQLQPGALTLIGNNVTTSGPTAFKSNGVAGNWDASVYTDQSYTNGCSLSAYCGQITAGLMVGLTYNPALSDSYNNLAFAFWCQAGGVLGLFEGGILYSGALGTYTSSAQLNVIYDGKYVAYYVNGECVRSIPLASGIFFAQICFAELGDLAYGIEFLPVATSTVALTLNNFNAYSVCTGSRASKVAGGGGWNAAVFSAQSYSNGCALSANPTVSIQSMLGLTGNPTYSVDYSNLAYAFFFAGGNYYIYESGAQILNGAGTGIWGTYAATTLFQITYDGKHVSYYVGGALARTVPITGQTYFAMVCLESVGDQIQNIDFGPLTMNTSTYTLVPLTNAVACSGTRATSLSTGGNTFGVHCFKSLESFGNGAIVSAQISPNVGAQFIGLASNPVAQNNYNTCVAMIYPHPDSATTQCFVNGANVFNTSFAPVAGDVYTLEYDLYNFYWFINNKLIFQYPYTGAPPLYLYGDFYQSGLGFTNISFYAKGKLSPNPWVATGANAVTHDSSAQKIGGTSAWDSAVYSINAYATAHIQGKANPASAGVMLGVTQTPPPISGNSSYTSLKCAWFSTPTGFWQIYEGATYIGQYNAATVSDVAAIIYDGTTITYLMNGVGIRSVSAAGISLYGMVAFYAPGAGVNNLVFGPGASVETIATATLETNAATSVVNAAVAGPVTITQPANLASSQWTVWAPITNIYIPGFAVPITVVFTCTGVGQMTYEGLATSVEVSMSTQSTAPDNLLATVVGENNYGNPIIYVTGCTGGSTPTGTVFNGSFAFEQYFSIAANSPTTFYLWGLCDSGGSATPTPAKISNVNIKAECIKR